MVIERHLAPYPIGNNGDFGMTVSPVQRLVSYLREFPQVRPAARAEAPVATPQPAPVNRPAPPRHAAGVAFAAAAQPAPGLRLPRGSLLNIVT